MKTLALVKREFLGTGNLWLASALVGLGIGFLPVFKSRSMVEIQIAGAWSIGLGFAVVVGLILGGAMFSGDLSSRKMGFWLARPIGTGELFFGRLLGRWGVASGTGLVVSLIATPFGVWRTGEVSVVWAFGLIIIALASVIIGHVVSIVFRARSLWVLLDFSLTLGIAFAIFGLWSYLWTRGAGLGFIVIMSFFSGISLLVLIAAGWFQVSLGRGDIRQSHRVLSVVLASGLAPLVVVSGAAGWAVIHPKSTDIRKVWIRDIQPNGPWVCMEGELPWFGRNLQRLLVNTDSGETQLIGNRGAFLSDGRWYQMTDADKSFELLPCELQNGHWIPRSAGLTFPYLMRGIVMSPDKGKVAVLQWDGKKFSAELSEPQLGRRMGKWSMPPYVTLREFPGPRLFFSENGSLKIFSRGDKEISAWKCEPGAATATFMWSRQFQVAIEWSDFMGFEYKNGLLAFAGKSTPTSSEMVIFLIKADSGEILVCLEKESDKTQFGLLSDGSFVVVHVRPEHIQIRRFDSKAGWRTVAELPRPEGGNGLSLPKYIGERVPDKVILDWLGNEKVPNSEIDMASGKTESIPDGLRVGRSQNRVFGGIWTRLSAGSDGCIWVRNSSGTLRRLTGPANDEYSLY